jgi:hypothetical protein
MADEATTPATPDGGTPPANPPAAPPVVDPVDAPPAGTIVDDGKAPITLPAADPATPPADDWRARIAGTDEKLLGFLGRYASEKAFVEAAKKDRDTLRNGLPLKPLSEDATPEEVAAYRKAFNVPEKSDAYLESLPDGLVVGDDDKPVVSKFAEAMHAANAPKSVVDAALSAYYDIVAEQDAAQLQLNEQARQAGIDALREEWGGDYRRNINVVATHLSTLPQAVQDVIGNARMEDGTLVGNNPEVLRWLADQALAANPLATVVPGAGANAGQAIADEIATIERTMRENRPAYNRDERMQARYRQLLEAREKAA